MRPRYPRTGTCLRADGPDGGNRGIRVLDDIAGCGDSVRVARGVAHRTVAMVAFDGFQMLDVVGPAEVLAGASRVLGDSAAYRLILAAPERGPVVSGSGL